MPLEKEVPQISTPQGGTQGLLFCEYTAPLALSGKAPSSLKGFQNFCCTFSHDTQRVPAEYHRKESDKKWWSISENAKNPNVFVSSVLGEHLT
jgi:hypothetical protein